MKAISLNDRLVRAIDQNLPNSVQKAIAAGAELDFCDLHLSPLVMALKMTDLRIARILLQAGADPNFLPPLGYSALFVAAENSNTEAIDLLLRHGADPNIESGEALLRCAKYRNSEAVQLLLNFGANPNSQGIFANSSPLHEVARLYAESPKDLYSVPYWGMRLVEVENPSFGTKKSRKEARENLYNEYIESGMSVALKIIETGGDVNHNCNGLGAPLHEAVDSGNFAMVVLLIGKKASPEIMNSNGDSVISMIEKSSNAMLLTVVKELLKING